MKKDIEQLLKKKLKKEAEEIEKEVLENKELKDVKPTEEMHRKLMEKIQAYETEHKKEL